jgi:competence ComEA-like helix-hairpin-helix protein
MPLSLSNQEVTYEQKKDDRLIVLLGIGGLLLLSFFLQQNSVPVSSGKELQLQWRGGEIVVCEKDISSPLQTQEGEEAAIPAVLTPFFFAPLPINEADQDLLETLTGIGPHLAAEIIKTREKQGPFRRPEDLLTVRGIGKKRMLMFAGQFSYR